MNQTKTPQAARKPVRALTIDALRQVNGGVVKTIPPLEGGAKDPAYMTVKFECETIR